MSSEYTESSSFVDHNRQRQRSSASSERRYTIKETIRKCSKAIERGRRKHYYFIATKLKDTLLPLLLDSDDRTPADYDAVLSDEPKWSFTALTDFYESPEKFTRTVSPGQATRKQAASNLTLQSRGYKASETASRAVIEGAFKSCAAIAEYEDLVPTNLKSRVDAVGFSIKLGEQLQNPEMSFGDPVHAVTTEMGPLKHFYVGGTGSGKSTAGGRQFEDYYRESLGDGRDIKCLDFVGMGEGENVLYDIPQSQSALQHVREQHDLPPTFEEVDDYEPELDVYVPLTETVQEKELPHNTETGECVAKPFTIPASDLSEGLLTAILEQRLSPQESQTIRDAYQSVDAKHPDWCLDDLAEEIRNQEELSDKHKKDGIRALRTLQSMGFIRDRTDPQTLNWEDVYTSTDRITAFSQATCESELGELIVVAFLLDNHWRKRWNQRHWPHSVVWLREISEIAMHQQHRRRRDDVEQAVVEWIIHRLFQIERKNRHIDTSLIADTQNANHVEKANRQEFNRYVVFNGTDAMIKDVFSWTSNDGWPSLKRTLSDQAGQAGIVGGTEPSARDSDRWGLSPVQLAPPSWHTYDTDNEETNSGWHARCVYGENEELRTPDWQPDLPDAYSITTTLGQDDEDDGPEKVHPKELHRKEARERRRMGESYREIRDNIPDNPETGKEYGTTTIKRWTEGIEKGSGKDRLEQGGGTRSSAD